MVWVLVNWVNFELQSIAHSLKAHQRLINSESRGSFRTISGWSYFLDWNSVPIMSINGIVEKKTVICRLNKISLGAVSVVEVN